MEDENGMYFAAGSRLIAYPARESFVFGCSVDAVAPVLVCSVLS
jgi:hypothetical protein